MRFLCGFRVPGGVVGAHLDAFYHLGRVHPGRRVAKVRHPCSRHVSRMLLQGTAVPALAFFCNYRVCTTLPSEFQQGNSQGQGKLDSLTVQSPWNLPDVVPADVDL
jgi:hypothetical protein